MAMTKTFNTKAKISFFLNMELRMINSGMLAPAPSITSAMTVPTPMPLLTRATAMGITVSARKYS